MGQLGFHWMSFMKFDIRVFLKNVDRIQVSLKSDKNNWYFT